jgi:hypothetical protein
MLAVGRPGAEKELGWADWSVCSGSQTCFRVASPTGATVGTNAGSFNGGVACKTYCSGAACTVYLYKDASGWHFVNARCYQSFGYVPGRQDRVFVTGCANFRTLPSLSGKVLGCLGDRTIVDVDSAPVYAEGHIWWHLAGRGWMAHDFLVAPKNCGC